MFVNNPYAQAGWYNPQNPYSVGNGGWSPSGHPPTFGSLPPIENRPASVLTFEFYLNPDALNCKVIGPNKMQYFDIKTTLNSTVIFKPGDQFGIINWGQQPIVEARGILPRQRTGEFLKLSTDQTYVGLTLSRGIIPVRLTLLLLLGTESWSSTVAHTVGSHAVLGYM